MRLQAMDPQHPVPTPPSVGVHVAVAPAQQARPVAPCAQRSPWQHSSPVVHPVLPAGRQAAVVWHTPPVQREPVQQSLSSTHASPSAWQAQWPESSQSI